MGVGRKPMASRVRRVAAPGRVLAVGVLLAMGGRMASVGAAPPAAHASSGRAGFQRDVIDATSQTGGEFHKAHLLGRLSRDPYLDAGAETRQGFTLYRYSEGWKPYVIFHDDSGPEDAHAADIDGDGWNDIVIGGWSNRLLWAQNPAGQGKDPYTTPWTLHTVDSTRWSHDSLPRDMDHDGKCDIVTNAGIYFQGATPNSWAFKDLGRGARALGTEAGTVLHNGDGYDDVIATRQFQGHNQVCWYENPGHHSGRPRTDEWRVHIIDDRPGGVADANCDEMSFALGDVDGDGRPDVVAATQGEGPDNTVSQLGDGLVWYKAPRDPVHGAWKKTVINPKLGYIHTSSLQLADFDGDGRLDISFAQQEQSGPTPNPGACGSGEPKGQPRQQVGIYWNTGGGRSWALQILTQYPDAAAGGFNSKVGKIGSDRLPSILTANHGYCGQPNPVVLFRNLSALRRRR